MDVHNNECMQSTQICACIDTFIGMHTSYIYTYARARAYTRACTFSNTQTCTRT